jgi:hypothetical protein
MPSDAQKRYYEKNREALTAKMRERDAERRAVRTQYLEEHPEEVGLRTPMFKRRRRPSSDC